jgi:hypothetical protein
MHRKLLTVGATLAVAAGALAPAAGAAGAPAPALQVKSAEKADMTSARLSGGIATESTRGAPRKATPKPAPPTIAPAR